MSSTASHRTRRALVIGALGVALVGGGGAAVWAASTPSPSPSAPSQGPQSTPHRGGHGQGLMARGGLHGEVTVKRADGTFVTLVGQRGTVTEATDTRLTVKSEDGYTHSYVLDGSTKFRSASDPKGGALKASDLKVGDEVAVRAQRSGSDDTASAVVKGPFAVRTGQAQGNQGNQGHGGRLHRHSGTQGGQSPSPSPSSSPSASRSVSQS
ncbi:hypothetical protein [Sinomonas atrocyanea]|uniref:hypothetical protein n=1 Tax=Sinomonas atrocyanea TaxID=37927 RepID=UPI002786804A|nr:hypothetical protein [Sinomonas atrocyanea]MDQ0259795.1 hypothetical protein [Sinomonas atrocyanea]MDR6621760.1 hypothetical protein [Sinomonas atrocyanea]